MSAEGQLDGVLGEVRELRTAVAKLQGDHRRATDRLDEASGKTSAEQAAFESRLTALERQQATFEGRADMAFEALAQRATELGIAITEMPQAPELHGALQQLEALRTWSEAALQDARQSAEARLVSLEADLQDCRSACATRVESAETALEQHRQDSKRTLTQSCDLANQSASQSKQMEEALGDIQRRIWGEIAEIADQERQRHLNTPLVTSLADLSAQHKREVAELRSDCQALQKCLASKVDVGHTHDRLISADGATIFAL